MTAEWCWSVFWLVLLLLIVWPLSLILAILYVIFSPFSSCCQCTDQLTDFFHKGLDLPLKVSKMVVQGKSPDLFDASNKDEEEEEEE